MNSVTICHDLRSRFGEIRDQGVRPTCLAFATSDAHAATRSLVWHPMSCEYLFYYSKKRDGSAPTKGAQVSSIRSTLDQDGQPYETGWPYLNNLPHNIALWEPPLDVGHVYRSQSSLGPYSFRQIWDCIEVNCPVVLCLEFTAEFYDKYGTGIVDPDNCSPPVARHAVIAVATGECCKRRFILVRNSWGAKWGLRGYGWLSERYLSPRIIDAFTVT